MNNHGTNTMTNDQLMELARERVNMKRGIKWHIIVYGILILFFSAVNVLTYRTVDETIWVGWIILGLAVPLVIHGVCILVKLSGSNNNSKVYTEYERLKSDSVRGDK